MRPSTRILVRLGLVLLALASAHANANAARSYTTGANLALTGHLYTPLGLDLSPDGLNLYAAGPPDGRIVVFDREPVSGRLTSIQTLSPLELPAPGGVVVSPDGNQVYATDNGFGNDILVYDRDAGTGTLTLAQVVTPASSTSRPRSPLVSPDGKHLYVSTNSGIGLYDRDLVTGFLTEVSDTGIGTGKFAISADGAHLYIKTTTPQGLSTFARDAVTGVLTLVDTDHPAGGFGTEPALPVLSPDDKFVYASNNTSLFVFSRDLVTGELTHVETEVDGVGGADGLYFQRRVRVSPDGLHLYIVSVTVLFLGGDNALATYSRDLVTGEVTFVAKDTSSTGARSSVEILMPPAGTHFYVSSHHDHGIAAFTRDACTGIPTFAHIAQSYRDLSALQITASGAHLYGAVPGSSAIAAMEPDTSPNELFPLEGVVQGVDGASGLSDALDVVLSPDEEHLYATSPTDGAVAVLDRDPGTGALQFVEAEFDAVGGVTGLAGARSVRVSPDGLHVYATGHEGDSVVAFGRAPVTGELTFIEAQTDGVAGIDGLDGANAVRISADGAHVYVAGSEDDAVAVFSRNPATGGLTFLEAHFDGAFGVSGLDGATALALSGDGLSVYVGGFEAPGIAAFSRDPSTGLLTFVDSETDGVLGSELAASHALWNLNGLEVHPNGEFVFSLSDQPPYLAVFRRDPTSGALTFVHNTSDGLNDGVSTGPRSLWMSTDGSQILATGTGDQRMATALLEDVACPSAPLVGCRTAPSGKLTLRTHTVPVKKRLKWLWVKGDATAVSEFDPGTDPYLFCGYDESGVTPTLTMETYIPADVDCTKKDDAKPCWNSGTVVSSYKHFFATPDGLGSIRLVSGDTGKAKIKMKGKGSALVLPPLPLSLPYRLQLQGPTGTCWESTYSTALTNNALQVKAKSDVP